MNDRSLDERMHSLDERMQDVKRWNANVGQALSSGQIQGAAGISGLQQDPMLRLKRANAIIDVLRVFYPNQVKLAGEIADTALKQ